MSLVTICSQNHQTALTKCFVFSFPHQGVGLALNAFQDVEIENAFCNVENPLQNGMWMFRLGYKKNVLIKHS